MITHRVAIREPGGPSPRFGRVRVDSWHLFGVLLIYRKETPL